MARYELNQLDPQSFTELCNALLHRVISERVTPGPLLGPDAAIDAYYEGPGKGDWASWDGAWIFQYKFHNAELAIVRLPTPPIVPRLEKSPNTRPGCVRGAYSSWENVQKRASPAPAE